MVLVFHVVPILLLHLLCQDSHWHHLHETPPASSSHQYSPTETPPREVKPAASVSLTSRMASNHGVTIALSGNIVQKMLSISSGNLYLKWDVFIFKVHRTSESSVSSLVTTSLTEVSAASHHWWQTPSGQSCLDQWGSVRTSPLLTNSTRSVLSRPVRVCTPLTTAVKLHQDSPV